jgi:hypothetical protein
MRVESRILDRQGGLFEEGRDPFQRDQHAAFDEKLSDRGFIIRID